MKIRLFYSYSRKDTSFREEMEKSLVLLKQDGLTDWKDTDISPGQNISDKIKENIDKSDIVVFLFSQGFIESLECKKEWDRVKDLNKGQIRIPIIVKECPWQDYSDAKDLLALPKNGVPITNIGNDKGFTEVYQGLKQVIGDIKNNFTIDDNVRKEFQETELASQEHINLNDIFVFPTLKKHEIIDSKSTYEKDIKNVKQLLKDKLLIIRGEERSGKTILGRHLFFHLLDNEHSPVLLINLKDIAHKKPNKVLFQQEYEKQFKGDFSNWLKQENKTIIFDDLTQASLRHVTFAKEYFDRIIVFTTDILFQSYFHDEKKLIKFAEIKIDDLSHVTQEALIRKRLKFLPSIDSNDAQVDQIENKVNEIINNKILPRYPFYILSILQTYESFMPTNLEISSYGHCYYVLIVSNFIKSGIDKSDSTLEPCFNFCKELAYAKYKAKMARKEFDFGLFLTHYNKKFPALQDSVFNRLKDEQYGVLKENDFKNKYMYYFFLGQYLAHNKDKEKGIIEAILKKSYIESNSLILLFLLHHLKDDKLIENILAYTMRAFDDKEPAKLDKDETKILQSVIRNLNLNILQDDTEEARKKQRLERDKQEEKKNNLDEDKEIEDEESPEFSNDIYKVLKNNKLLGQILRNKGGSLEKNRIAEIITTIADSGLRLVKLSLSEDELNKAANYLYNERKANTKGEKEVTLDKIKKLLTVMTFFWVVINIEKIVTCLNISDLRELIIETITNKNTPAYDLIAYFVVLDSTVDAKDEKIAKRLASLLKKYRDDQFIKSISSIRTQHYLNTHRLDAPLEQKICSLLKLKYKYKLK